ncbi:MAG: hypothetical protein VYE50_01010 [Candidatus Thermoplasmatota archaeon]|nr:hypothetical protein [Candidatus Thermoplasmatota archaeon]MED6305697.1 hypothetical protein [Candidatus Thermoplasmatota archaeon]
MAQRREPGVLVLANELSRAVEKHVENREYSPTYLISEIGAKLSRVLIGGVLDQIENRGSEDDPFYTARVIDPNGDFYYLQAGQYNPEGATALSKLEIGVPVLCIGKVRARTPEDSERTYVSVQPENIRAVSMDDVNHWAIKTCDQLMRRINANKAFGNDDVALKRADLTVREMDGLELSKDFYPTVAVENYAALLYDCLTRLAGGEVSMPETKNFTGEFEAVGTVAETADGEAEEKEVPRKDGANDNEAKIMKLIKEDEGDGIYYDDLAIKISSEGVDNPMLDEILDSLTDQGLVFQPRFNHYKEA